MNAIKSIPSKTQNHLHIYEIEHFSYLLGFSLVWALVLVINAREIWHNDEDGNGDDQDSVPRANATNHFAYCLLNVLNQIDPFQTQNHLHIYEIEHFSYLLGFSLVWALVLVINAREIWHNDEDGNGDDQDSVPRANATNHFAYCLLNVLNQIDPFQTQNHLHIYEIEHFSYLLGFSLVWALVLVINAREIRHNDGDGKGDDQDSGQGANATNHFAYCRAGHHVTISEILIKIE